MRSLNDLHGTPADAVRPVNTHYVQLDGLRGAAILLVMIYHFALPHSNSNSHDAGWLLQLAHVGWVGVDLFFVLSGFLITGILVATRDSDHYLRNFLARRFLRIWPLYYASLAILLLILPALHSVAPAALASMQQKQAWFWLYGANWLFAAERGFEHTSGGYYWSLAVEEQFYLVWPLVVYCISERALLRTSVALLVTSLLARVVLIHIGIATNSLYAMTFTHWDGLAVGSCLALCMRSESLIAKVSRLVPLCVFGSFLGLVIIRFVDQDFLFWSTNVATYGYTLIAVLFGSLLFHVVRQKPGSGVDAVFTNRFMTQAGKYSYALYMVHVPVASLLFPAIYSLVRKSGINAEYDLVYGLFVLASFALSWLLAVASWHLFEKHILGLKRYFN